MQLKSYHAGCAGGLGIEAHHSKISALFYVCIPAMKTAEPYTPFFRPSIHVKSWRDIKESLQQYDQSCPAQANVAAKFQGSICPQDFLSNYVTL